MLSYDIYLCDEHPNLSPYSFIIFPSVVAHFLACCSLSYCGLGERFKVIVSRTLILHPSLPLLSSVLTSRSFFPPATLTCLFSSLFLFLAPAQPLPRGLTPLCLNPAVVLIVFLPPGEPSNEIPFGNQDLSAWRDVHVFYLFKCLFLDLSKAASQLCCLLQPVFFFSFFLNLFFLSAISLMPLVWCSLCLLSISVTL